VLPLSSFLRRAQILLISSQKTKFFCGSEARPHSTGCCSGNQRYFCEVLCLAQQLGWQGWSASTQTQQPPTSQIRVVRSSSLNLDGATFTRMLLGCQNAPFLCITKPLTCAVPLAELLLSSKSTKSLSLVCFARSNHVCVLLSTWALE